MDDFRYDNREIRKRNHHSASEGKKRNTISEVLTFQAIICVLLAIILLVFHLFSAQKVNELHTDYQEYTENSGDWWNDLASVWNKAVDTITKPKKDSVSSTQSAAGGEPNPFGPYNKIMAPPDYATFSPCVYSSTITVPVSGNITSQFGYRYHPITGQLDFHKGVDIAADYQTPILAAISGEVIKVGENASAGKYITLSHGNGLCSKYMHCSTVIAKEDMQIREGEVIAKVGSTGMSTGNHLHFQLEKDGIVFDPSWIINFGAPENREDSSWSLG